MISAILTDIEGTTSSIAFVKDVLFPYAARHLSEFVRSHAGEPEVRAQLAAVGEICGETLEDAQVVEVLLQWIKDDRKLTPLKALQGMIWEAGYRNGDLYGHVYADAERKLREWRGLGISLYVYSSGSVHAQKLLFGHTEFGDLTPLFSGYFDTHVGAKQEPESYRKIAGQIGLPPESILFLSDMAGELDAAAAAGMKTCQLLREGLEPKPGHASAGDFDGIDLI